MHTNSPPLPRLLVTRAIFPDVVERLRQHFEVIDNHEDALWTRARMAERLRDCDAVLTTPSETLDGEFDPNRHFHDLDRAHD